MTAVSKNNRAALRKILERSLTYDALTLQISAAGVVSAKPDPDKTLDPRNTARREIAHIDEMIDANGSVREGWQ